jgi:aldose 1-epimerase
MAGDIIRLEAGGLAVEASPLGGAILSAYWNDIPVLAPTPSPGLASTILGAEACFPLVPFGNRIENNGFRFEARDHVLLPNTADPLVLHGDGWLRRWTLAERTPHRIVFHHRHEADAASPFDYEATQTIALGEDYLTLSLDIVNRAAGTLPYGLGFHPYFPRTPTVRLFASAGRYAPERELHLPAQSEPVPHDLDFSAGAPLPARWLNNAFDGWDGAADIEYPETGLILSLEADDTFRFFTLYAPAPEAGFFCFEPMTHRPNAHNAPDTGGLVPLAPGERLAGTLTIRCRRGEA